MDRMIEALGDDRPLHGDVIERRRAWVFMLRYRQGFIDRPARRAMIDDDVMPTRHGKGVALDMAYITQPRADVAHDDFVGVDVDFAIAQRDALPWRSLSGDGDEGMPDREIARERDRAGDPEHDDARAFRLHRRAQR